jgi:hypothetical protein
MAEGFSKKNSVRDADWAVMAEADPFRLRGAAGGSSGRRQEERKENINRGIRIGQWRRRSDETDGQPSCQPKIN